MSFVEELGENNQYPDPRLLGRKGMRLVELAETEEINVPEGLVVTTTTYDEFMNQIDIEEELPWIDEQTHDIDIEYLQSRNPELSEVHNETEKVFQETELPTEPERQIESLLSKDDFPYIARSSAVNEDHYLDAGAGQMESHDIHHLDELDDAYKRVLASAFSPQSLSTIKENNLFNGFGKMAVVIQDKVNAHGGGVSFSTDQNQPDILNISAADSPWEAVDSNVNDRFFVNHEDLEEDRDRLGWDHKQVQENAEHRLTDRRVDEVARTNFLIEQMYPQDSSMDTEFAYDQNGELYIVQTRPYTGVIEEDTDLVFEEGSNSYRVLDDENEEILEIAKNDILAETEMGTRGEGIHEGPAAVVTDSNTEGYTMDNGDSLSDWRGEDYILVTPKMYDHMFSEIEDLDAIVASEGDKNSHAANAFDDYGATYVSQVEQNPEDVLSSGDMVYVVANKNKGILAEGEIN